jgi:transcriptional regulator with XRE-family HTH domain
MVARRKATSRRVAAGDRAIGARLRFQRLKIAMSQDTLAQQLGLSFQQIQKYENGTNRITGDRLYQVCRAIGVDPNYLLGWDEHNEVTRPVSSDSVRLAYALETVTPSVRVAMLDLMKKLSVAVVANSEKQGQRARR